MAIAIDLNPVYNVRTTACILPAPMWCPEHMCVTNDHAWHTHKYTRVPIGTNIPMVRLYKDMQTGWETKRNQALSFEERTWIELEFEIPVGVIYC